jgi:hypothetical protein
MQKGPNIRLQKRTQKILSLNTARIHQERLHSCDAERSIYTHGMPSAPPQSLQPLGFAYTLPPGRNYDPSREKRSTDAEKTPSIPTAHCTRWRWLTSCPQLSNSTQIPRTDPPMPVPNTPRTELPQAHRPDELKLVSSNPQQRTLHELSSTTPHASFRRRQNSPTPAHNPHSPKP